VAWPILAAGIDAAVAVDDPAAVETLRRLAHGADGDAALEIGETGIAALAALVRSATTPADRAALALGPGSDAVAIACEGVTDPAVFARLCR
jgi:diaminopropionate ammonia-lyase